MILQNCTRIVGSDLFICAILLMKRSCEALKVDGLIVTGHANELIPWFSNIKSSINNFCVIGSTSKADKLVMDANLINPMALLIGNETYGLSNNYKAICDTLIKIPMGGNITSFNVACAASIILYEITRQRKNII